MVRGREGERVAEDVADWVEVKGRIRQRKAHEK